MVSKVCYTLKASWFTKYNYIEVDNLNIRREMRMRPEPLVPIILCNGFAEKREDYLDHGRVEKEHIEDRKVRIVHRNE